jgi:hypothetical protein
VHLFVAMRVWRALHGFQTERSIHGGTASGSHTVSIEYSKKRRLGQYRTTNVPSHTVCKLNKGIVTLLWLQSIHQGSFGSGVVDACDCKVPAVRHWRKSGKELIVSRRVLGTIVCLLTAQLACFSLFFFKAFVRRESGSTAHSLASDMYHRSDVPVHVPQWYTVRSTNGSCSSVLHLHQKHDQCHSRELPWNDEGFVLECGCMELTNFILLLYTYATLIGHAISIPT